MTAPLLILAGMTLMPMLTGSAAGYILCWKAGSAGEGELLDTDTFMFFSKVPQALPLYEVFAGKLLSMLDNVTVRVQKTQITFSSRFNFACVSLPARRLKDRPGIYIIVTFGLGRPLDDPRIEVCVEPYPNRWTHHVIVQRESDIDAQLMEWVREAYVFALNK